jgi:5-methylcytosine-specific restriction endonuclease McrA
VSLRRKIRASVQREVRQTARHLCEYCHTAEQWQYVPFTVDHVVPLAHGGSNSSENLALACFHCNRRKSDQEIVLDSTSGHPVPLFNPRTQAWNEHFIWSSDRLRIIGLTPQGQATVKALQFNRERVLRLRAADISAGRHPPEGDPVQGNL